MILCHFYKFYHWIDLSTVVADYIVVAAHSLMSHTVAANRIVMIHAVAEDCFAMVIHTVAEDCIVMVIHTEVVDHTMMIHVVTALWQIVQT